MCSLTKLAFASFIGGLLLLGCATTDRNSVATTLNTLSAAEKKSGWKLLFDGQSLAGWRSYRKTEAPQSGWVVKNNCLELVAGSKAGDIISEKAYTDFDLRWEWRIAPGANNGIKYLVQEDRPSAPGPEYQMIDDVLGADAGRETHRTAALYDIISARKDKPVRPAGEWNSSRIFIKGKHVEHWLNGMKVVEYELESPALKEGIAQSKFKTAKGFGDKVAGHIMLTYHNDETWYRNVKIRELK